jgi:hypothetical protein
MIKKKYTITICTVVLTTILLYIDKIDSGDWVELVKWLIGFMTAGFIGKKVLERNVDSSKEL